MKGSGTQKIGTRLEIVYPKSTISDQELIKLYNENVNGTSYNWVTIKLSDNYGIKASSGNPFLDFGTLDKLGMVTSPEKTGVIRGDKVEYRK